MGDNTKIITIDAQILNLRKEIDAAVDKTAEAIVAKQREVDKLIAARYALLLKMQNRTSDTPPEAKDHRGVVRLPVVRLEREAIPEGSSGHLILIELPGSFHPEIRLNSNT